MAEDERCVAEEVHPEGVPAFDLPPQPAVFAPGTEPEEIAQIAAKLREAAGLPAKPPAAWPTMFRGATTVKVSWER